jgi:hypothetical protein
MIEGSVSHHLTNISREFSGHTIFLHSYLIITIIKVKFVLHKMAYIISYSRNLEEHFGINCKRIVILQTVLVHIKMEGMYGRLQHMSVE